MGQATNSLDDLAASAGHVYLTKYDGAGHHVWTVGDATAGNVSGYGSDGLAVGVDGGGDVFVAGDTDGPLDGQTVIGLLDYFVSKYTPE